MLATRLKGTVTTDHKLVVKLPKSISTGEVEVILLHQRSELGLKKGSGRKLQHPAFGMWADRSDIADAAVYATALRQGIERRLDAAD
jgi:hypothetical protein